MEKQLTFLEKVNLSFSAIAEEQENKGMEKYGHEVQPLEKKWDWLKMAGEELVDAFKYLAAEHERRDYYLTLALGELKILKKSYIVLPGTEVEERIEKIEQAIKVILGGIK